MRRTIVAVALACALLSAVPMEMSREPGAGVVIKLTAEEAAACDAGGGCALFPREKLKEFVRDMAAQAFEAGKRSARARCGGDT